VVVWSRDDERFLNPRVSRSESRVSRQQNFRVKVPTKYWDFLECNSNAKSILTVNVKMAVVSSKKYKKVDGHLINILLIYLLQ